MTIELTNDEPAARTRLRRDTGPQNPAGFAALGSRMPIERVDARSKLRYPYDAARQGSRAVDGAGEQLRWDQYSGSTRRFLAPVLNLDTFSIEGRAFSSPTGGGVIVG